MNKVFEKYGWEGKMVSGNILIFTKDKYELQWDSTCDKCKISWVFKPTDDEITIMGYKTHYSTLFLGLIRTEEEYVTLSGMIF